MEPQNNLGIDHLVDVAVDIIETSDIVAKALSDGLDITDVGAVWKAAPRLAEIVQEGKEAYNELLDLTPEESTLAAQQIAERANLPATGVLGKVNSGLILLARTHQEIADDIDLAQDWLQWAKSLRNADAEQN